VGLQKTEIDNREILASFDSQSMVLKDKIEKDDGEKCYIYPNGMVRYNHGDTVKNIHIDPFKTPVFGFVSGTDDIRVFKYGLGVMTVIDLSSNNEKVYHFSDQRTKVKENSVKIFNGLLHVLASNGMYPYSLFRSERGSVENDFHFTKTDYIKPFIYPVTEDNLEWEPEEPGAPIAEPPPPPTHQTVTYSVDFGTINVRNMMYGTVINNGDKVAIGTEIMITAAPEDRYTGNTWVVNGQTMAVPNNVWTMTVGLDPINVSIKFIKHTYLINVSTIKVFETRRIPYSQGEPQIVDIENIGTGVVTLAQPSSNLFELGPLSRTRLNPGDTASMTIRPMANLNTGANTEDIIISGNDGANGKLVASIYIQAAYTYIFVIADNMVSLDFGSVRLPDYQNPAAKTVTLKNNGTGEITGINIPAVNNYEITGISKTTLSPNETLTFKVQPKDGIGAGTKNESIVVKGDNGAQISIPAIFTVESQYNFGINLRYVTESGGSQTTVAFDERHVDNQINNNTQPPPVSLIVSNTGSGPVKLNPPVITNDDKWTVGSLSAGTSTPLASNGTAQFTLRPKNNIGAGAHSTSVTVSGVGQHANGGDTVEVTTNALVATYNVIAPTSQTVSFSSGSGGKIKATVDGVEIVTGVKVVSGKEITFTATPEVSHNMGSWGGALSGSELTKKITVGSSDINVTVSFNIKTFNVSIGSVDGGKITAMNGGSVFTGGSVNYGANLRFTATPNDGYGFGGWSGLPGGASINDNVAEVTVYEGFTVSATMNAVPKRQVSWNVTGGEMQVFKIGNGNDTLLETSANNTIQVYEGVTLKFKAVPSSGYLDTSNWEGWFGNSVVNNEWTVYIGSGSVDVRVVFEKERTDQEKCEGIYSGQITGTSDALLAGIGTVDLNEHSSIILEGVSGNTCSLRISGLSIGGAPLADIVMNNVNMAVRGGGGFSLSRSGTVTYPSSGNLNVEMETGNSVMPKVNIEKIQFTMNNDTNNYVVGNTMSLRMKAFIDITDKTFLVVIKITGVTFSNAAFLGYR